MLLNIGLCECLGLCLHVRMSFVVITRMCSVVIAIMCFVVISWDLLAFNVSIF